MRTRNYSLNSWVELVLGGRIWNRRRWMVNCVGSWIKILVNPPETHWPLPSAGVGFPKQLLKAGLNRTSYRKQKVGDGKSGNLRVISKPKPGNLMGLGQWILQSPGCGREIWGNESWWECACVASNPSLPPYNRSVCSGTLPHDSARPTTSRVYIPLCWLWGLAVLGLIEHGWKWQHVRLQEKSHHGFSPALLNLFLLRWD